MTGSLIAQKTAQVPCDLDQLQAFEANLDPALPEANPIPCRVLGYGEISTVFAINLPGFEHLAFKRMSVFLDRAELETYLRAYDTYHELLPAAVGFRFPAHGYAAFHSKGRPIFYVIQQRLPAPALCQNAVHRLPPDRALSLFAAVLELWARVCAYNRRDGDYQIGFDAQISNWAIALDDPLTFADGAAVPLLYIDTSTPLFRIDGREQLQADLFLRPAATFLQPVLRRWFLADVVNRYYDPREVVTDLIANLYKEQMPELIPPLLELANDCLVAMNLAPLTAAGIRGYYRQDRFIWRLYAGSRRLDRRLHRLTSRTYPYILPGRVKR